MSQFVTLTRQESNIVFTTYNNCLIIRWLNRIIDNSHSLTIIELSNSHINTVIETRFYISIFRNYIFCNRMPGSSLTVPCSLIYTIGFAIVVVNIHAISNSC